MYLPTVLEHPGFTALVPCPTRKMPFTLNVPENLVTNYPDFCTAAVRQAISAYYRNRDILS